MPDPFDKEALMDRLDGDVEFLAETVEILDEDGPPLMEELRAAAAAADAERIAKAAHAIKGMVSNFCAEPAHAASLRIEEMGRAGAIDDVDEAIAGLENESTRLKSALVDFVQGLQG